MTEIMEIENITRYTELAVGLKPSAMGCEAHLRELERSNFSTTITLADPPVSGRAGAATPRSRRI